MSDMIDGSDNDIKIVNERLRSLYAGIRVPDGAKAEILAAKLDGANVRKGRILNFRTAGIAAAAIFVVAITAVALPRLKMNGAVPEPRAAEFADNEAEETEAPRDPCCPEAAAAAEEGAECEEMREAVGEAEGEAPGYREAENALRAIFAGGTALTSVPAQEKSEDTLEYKYREISVGDEGNSVSVLIYDKENGGTLLKGFWVQGEYVGAADDGNDRVTIMTEMAVTEDMMSGGSFVPVYLDENGVTVLVPGDAIKVNDGAYKAVFTVYVDIELESGNYTVRAELN